MAKAATIIEDAKGEMERSSSEGSGDLDLLRSVQFESSSRSTNEGSQSHASATAGGSDDEIARIRGLTHPSANSCDSAPSCSPSALEEDADQIAGVQDWAVETSTADNGSQNVTTTTLMIRNLPHNISQSDLAKDVDQSGFVGTYDFLYMPSSFASGRGRGYAFVNFADPVYADKFMKLWHNQRRLGMNEKTSLDISSACVQGHSANVAKWGTGKTNRIRNPNYRPLIKIVTSNPEGGVAVVGDTLTPSVATAKKVEAKATANGSPQRKNRQALEPPMPGLQPWEPAAAPPSGFLSTGYPGSQQQLPPLSLSFSPSRVQMAPWNAQGSDIFVGRWATIVGLRQAPEFNGRLGFVEDFDVKMQRYLLRVPIDDAGNKVALKLQAENLRMPDMPHSSLVNSR